MMTPSDSNKDKLLYLSAHDVDATGLDMPQAIDAVLQVLVMHSRREVILPSKVILDMDERRHGRVEHRKRRRRFDHVYRDWRVYRFKRKRNR